MWDNIYRPNSLFPWHISYTKQERNLYFAKNYAKEILKKIGMEKCNLTLVKTRLELKENMKGDIDSTYFKSLAESLRYLTCTRLDIFYRVRLVNKYIEIPDQSHLNATKRIIHFIKGSLNKGLF
jgi:hypothetical protein